MKAISCDNCTISYDRILCAEIINDEVWVTIERSGVEHRHIITDGHATPDELLKNLRQAIHAEREAENYMLIYKETGISPERKQSNADRMRRYEEISNKIYGR